jgi:murein L,D-transpeptidase YcbB/YkuD
MADAPASKFYRRCRRATPIVDRATRFSNGTQRHWTASVRMDTNAMMSSAMSVVSQFFAVRNGKPAWRPDTHYEDLVRAIERVSGHGHNPGCARTVTNRNKRRPSLPKHEAYTLGYIQIVFPDKRNVYLHDTPTLGLFSGRQHAFLSDCLWTRDPVDISAWPFEETPLGCGTVRCRNRDRKNKTSQPVLAVPNPHSIFHRRNRQLG